VKTIVVEEFGGPEALRIVDRDPGVPGPTQVLVDVHTSAINWIDVSARAGRLTAAGMLPPIGGTGAGLGLGWDVAGTVAALGAEVRGLAVGDAVIGLRDLLLEPGTHAEAVVLDVTALARAPRTIPLADAGGLPLAGTTAWQAIELAGVRPGHRVLITGATGAVGRLSTQLARLRRATVVVAVRPGDDHAADDLDADHVVPSGPTLGHAVRALVPGGVDIVIDAANLGVAAHHALRAGGTFVAMVRPLAPPPIRDTRVLVQESFADSGTLAVVAALVDAGHLDLPTARVYPLDDAVAAYRSFEDGGHRGRILVSP